VHPMRASAISELLAQAGAAWKVVDDLIAAGSLTEVTYRNERYYLRRWARKISDSGAEVDPV